MNVYSGHKVDPLHIKEEDISRRYRSCIKLTMSWEWSY